MAKITRRQLIRMIEAMEPAVRDAFFRAIGDIRSQAVVGDVERLLAAGRVDDVITALGIDPARFSDLAEQVRTVFVAGGKQGIAELPVLRSSATVLQGRWGVAKAQQMAVRINFDLRNPRAEAWLSQRSSRLVTAIVEDQRNSIRAVVTEGMRIGRGPRQAALDIVGRIGVTGRRTGGIVGLTSQQAQFVLNARADLLSGDPARMAAYFGRKRRDKRLDGIVKRAIKAGKPVSMADVDKIAGRYSDRLLALRGEMIARTESIQAFNTAREEAFMQAIESGALLAESVVGVWGATGDTRTRESHAEMNGQERPLGKPFETPSGALMLYPGDTSFGAGAEEIVACRCSKIYRVDNAAEALRGR